MFISLKQEIEDLIACILKNPLIHGRWLNTLSFLEHAGACKIAASAHPSAVREERLKHAAEEFRHAYYLKNQLHRIGQVCVDYRSSMLLGGWETRHYLRRLNLFASRENRPLAYWLVTYAIELRAAELYPLYQSALQKISSPIRVQSILLEEKEHLEEMERELSRFPDAKASILAMCEKEGRLCRKWIFACNSCLNAICKETC